MAEALAPSRWADHPLAGALLRFNMLPSLDLHPARAGAWTALQQAGAGEGLHRHWSASLLRELGLASVTSLEEPALPVAMLPSPAFPRLLVYAGIALDPQPLKRAIAREDVAALQSQLGADALAFARARPPQPLVAVPQDWKPSGAAAGLAAWGEAVLARAFDAASPAVAGRARLRLDPAAEPVRAQLAAAGLDAARALDLALELVHHLEPQWLSSFPAAR